MNDAAMPAIDVQDAGKMFRDFWRRPKVQAVDGVSFTIRRGEVFGLLGPNGSGKSTTIKMILGLLFPSRGTIRVLGRSPRDVQIKRRIGYLPEESYLYGYLTSWETLDFYGRLFDLDRAERRQRIEQLLDMIGLRHARNRIVGEFSKGMARRIGLAQALINDPDVVILDEPTSGLDPIGCRQIKDLILTLARRGKTVLMTSHLLADVEDVCDRVAILYNGRVQAQGTIDELLQEAERFRIALPAGATRAQVEQLAAEASRMAGGPAIVEHPRRDLEQFFLQVVEKARARETESSGVGRDQGLADYLQQRPATTESAASAPPPAADRKDIDQALSNLIRPDPPK